MKNWMRQIYIYHHRKIPLDDLSVNQSSQLNDYSIVIELRIFKKYKEKSLPTLREFIDELKQ